MKMKTLVVIGMALVFTGISAQAQDQGQDQAQDPEGPVLGTSHFAIEMAPMFIQHRTFATDDYGIFMGLSGYGHVGNDWYVGGEIGAGGAIGFFGLDSSSFTPIEANAKRGFRLSERILIDLGAGLSYGRVKFNRNSWFSEDLSVSDWVAGGQILSNFYYQAGWVQVGFKIKYQLTADAKGVDSILEDDEGWDYSNLRIGAFIGFRIP